MKGRFGGLIVTGLVAAATPASAQNAAKDAASTFDLSRPSEFVRVLQKNGYRAELKKNDKTGRPYIASAANGNDFSIHFYECDALNLSCKSIEFYSWWKKQPYFNVALANKWNAGKRFLKVAIDSEGDLEQRLYGTTVGMTEPNFMELLDWYESMDSDLAAFLRDEDPAKDKDKDKDKEK